MKVKHKMKLRRVPEYALVLKHARERRGAKQTTIAKRLGISNMGLSHWENGARIPKLDQLEEWAQAVGLEVVISFDTL